MTIPSLDGNGSNFNINIKQNIPVNPQQSASVQSEPVDINNSAPEPESSSGIENHNPALPREEKSNPAPSNNSSSQATPEDEYSIKQFRKDYQLRLEKDVMPILEGYEDERKKRFMMAVIAAVICVFAGLFIFFNFEGRSAGEAAGGCIAGAFAIWLWIKKSFEMKIKRLIMPTLMKAMHGFKWLEKPVVTAADISDCKIFPKADKAGVSFDDCFVGEYRGVPIAISECSYTIGSDKNRKTIFEGVVIRLRMNKKFEGLTVVRPKNVGLRDVSDLKKLKLPEVKLEDVEFNKNYVVYSTDQIESRYLLTTAFMDRFRDITMAFCSFYSFCSFYGDSVYIAPYCTSDLFNLCSLTKPVTNKDQFEQLFNEFVSVLQLVDHFKLDKKLGL